MDYYSNQITQLIEELGKLPGIGPKSAGRLAFHIINMPQDQVKKLSDTIISAKTNVHYCKECCTLTDNDICPICASDKRDHSTIMVVENTRDLMAYEKTGKYEGVYHVLHGAISPMLGIGPDDIRLKEARSVLSFKTIRRGFSSSRGVGFESINYFTLFIITQKCVQIVNKIHIFVKNE